MIDPWQAISYDYLFDNYPKAISVVQKLVLERDRLAVALAITRTAYTNHDGSITVQLDGTQAIEVGDEMDIREFVDAALATAGGKP